ncbi:hypothetical protein GmHk_16G046207 [Glycine max]|nr:hypothetical protein GmHk_16G046207 [Glycine max]
MSSEPHRALLVKVLNEAHPDMGLGKNNHGRASLVNIRENYGRCGLEYKPTRPSIRKSGWERRNRGTGPQSRPQVREAPPCHLNESVVSAGLRREEEVAMVHDEFPWGHPDWVQPCPPGFQLGNWRVLEQPKVFSMSIISDDESYDGTNTEDPAVDFEREADRIEEEEDDAGQFSLRIVSVLLGTLNEEYAQRWRDLVAQVIPSMTEKEMITIMVDTLPTFYYEKLIGYMPANFVDLVFAGERIEYASNMGPYNNRRAPVVGARKKEGDAHTVTPAPTWMKAPQNIQSSYHTNPPNFLIRAGNSLPTQVKGLPAAERASAQRTAPAAPRPVNNTAPSASYKYAQHPSPKDNFSPIPMAYSELWPSLLENHLVVATPGKVLQPPYPKWYDPGAKCAYHSGVPGHNIDSCIPFKYKVQHLISAGWLSFHEEGPNVKTNPLASHGGASVNATEEDGPSRAKRLREVATSRRFIYQSLQATCMVSRGGDERDECLFHLGESYDMETCPTVEELLQRFMDCRQLEMSIGGREEPQICMQSEEKKVPLTPNLLLPSLSNAAIMVAHVMLRNGFEPGMGLGKDGLGNADVVDIKGNPYKYGLGYEPRMPGRRNVPLRLRADRVWPGRISQCFTSAVTVSEEEVAAIEEEFPQDPPSFVQPCHPDSQEMAPRKLASKRSRKDKAAEGTSSAPEYDSHRFRSAEHQQRFKAIKGWSFLREQRVQLRDDEYTDFQEEIVRQRWASLVTPMAKFDPDIAQGDAPQATDAPPPHQAGLAGSFDTEQYLWHLVRQQAANHRAHVQTHDCLYQLSLSLQSQGFTSFPCPTPDQFRVEVAWPRDWPEARAGEVPAEAPDEAMLGMKQLMEKNAATAAAVSSAAEADPTLLATTHHPPSNIVGRGRDTLGHDGSPHLGYNRAAYPYGLPPNYSPPILQEDAGHIASPVHEKEPPQQPDELVGYMPSSFADLVFAGERIEVGLKRGKFDYVSSTNVNAKRIGATGAKRKEGDAHAVSSTPAWVKPQQTPHGTHQYAQHHPSFSAHAGNASSSTPVQPKAPTQREAPQVPTPNTARPAGNSNTTRNFPPRPLPEFTPLPMTYEDLLPSLIANHLAVVTPGRVLEPPFPKWYDPNATCKYHGGAPGHSIEKCLALKYKVQHLMDAGWLTFQEDRPNVRTNPLANHGGGAVNAVESDRPHRSKPLRDVATPRRFIFEALQKGGVIPHSGCKEDSCLLHPGEMHDMETCLEVEELLQRMIDQGRLEVGIEGKEEQHICMQSTEGSGVAKPKPLVIYFTKSAASQKPGHPLMAKPVPFPYQNSKDNGGITSLIKTQGNRGKYGLGYKPTQADMKRSIAGRKNSGQSSRWKQESEGNPPCHISRSFISAGLGDEGQVVAICEDDVPSTLDLVRPCPPDFQLGNWRVEERPGIYATSIINVPLKLTFQMFAFAGMAPRKLASKRSRKDKAAEGTSSAPEYDSHRFRSVVHQQRFEAIKGWSFLRERRVQLRDDEYTDFQEEIGRRRWAPLVTPMAKFDPEIRQAQGDAPQAAGAPPPPHQTGQAGAFDMEQYLRHLVRQQAANHRAHVRTHDCLYQMSLSMQSQGFAPFSCPTPDQFRAEVAWPGDWPEAQAGEAPPEAPGDGEEAHEDEEMADLLDFLGGSGDT